MWDWVRPAEADTVDVGMVEVWGGTAMSNDYLWDGSGAPDPEVQRLERLLAPLRTAPPPLRLPEPASRRRLLSFVPLLATAAAVVLVAGLAWRSTHAPRASSWEVASLTGRPRI